MRRRSNLLVLCVLSALVLSACGRLLGRAGATPERPVPAPRMLVPAISPSAPTPSLAPPATTAPTAEPTASPSPTAPPTAEVSRTAVITVNMANLRAGPGTEFEVVALAQKDQALPVLESDEHGNWFRVQLDDGSSAWVGSTVVVVNTVAGSGVDTPSAAGAAP